MRKSQRSAGPGALRTRSDAAVSRLSGGLPPPVPEPPAGHQPSSSLCNPIREELLAWYDDNRRDLPWRRTRDPYGIWISEVMAQQTRIEVVVPKWRAFLRAFPSVLALASASEEQVLALWSGLGYYSRARNLLRGAIAVRDEHGGTFPATREEALALPGIGPYTAAAVLSIAYGEKLPVVDGNVRRVLARLYRLGPLEDRAPSRLDALAGALLDRDRPGDFNQALMELGALVCAPRAPRCGACPIAFGCGARADGNPEAYPRRAARKEPVASTCALLLARDARGRLLLETGRWGLIPHLWVPPVTDGTDPASGLHPRVAAMLRTVPVFAGTMRHTITHHRIVFRVFRAGIAAGRGRLPAGYLLADAGRIAETGHSSVLEKALRVAARSETEEGSRSGTPSRTGGSGSGRASRCTRSRTGSP